MHLDTVYVIGEMLQGIQVSIQLIVETAFETAALSAQFALVDT